MIVSTIAGTGSSGALIAMQQDLSSGTGGQHFSSSVPAEDLADGIQSLIVQACDSVTDCNGNNVPDTCDLSAGTSNDCNTNDVPDECEADCNGNGIEDSCDIAADPSLDDNGDGIPDSCEVITLTVDTTDVLWTSVPNAIGYDLIRGDLGLLGSSAGNFTTATEECLGNDLVTTSLSNAIVDPFPPGAGSWFIVRGVLGTGNLSYDSFGGASGRRPRHRDRRFGLRLSLRRSTRCPRSRTGGRRTGQFSRRKDVHVRYRVPALEHNAHFREHSPRGASSADLEM